ncbi:MAG: ATP-binding protein [Thermoanaerobaculia bacterium]
MDELILLRARVADLEARLECSSAVACMHDRFEDDLATTLDCMADAVISTDIEGRVVRMNPSAELLTGWTEEEGRGRSLDELVRFLDQRTRHPVANVAEKVLREGLLVRFAHHTLLESRDGATRPVASSGAPIRDASGAVRGVVIVLRDMKEEYALTAMLQRAQKMEALGSLAAGVAHDFNNLLTVISGYSDILLGRLPPADPARGPIGQIKKAGEQAIVLTRQLLAFSRQQVLEPVVLNISGVVTAMHDMLARVVGERVEMASACEPGLANVLVDPGKLEQVIMNLVVNARDAMPEGGRLTIEASNVELDEAYADAHAEVKPGCYVMLAVSDTGCGMDAETQAQIFDPFFTTKAEGKGTGLGLATVFGIVRQSGGHIWVYSERDHGTMFKVYLPVVEQEASPRKLPVAERPPGGTETILVVEDDELVREITVEALRGCGYEILEAADGREAIEICEARSGAIDLLIADSVMPGMSGRVVAERIAAARPGIKVLFVSGYSEDTVIRHGLVESAIAFLQKPFSAAALAKKVREVLG